MSNNNKSVTYPTFDISQLPSVKDGMSIEEEGLKRKKTCRFIEEACRILKLPRVAVATALVFFHRFYAKHSFHKHDRFEVAVACILLAAKTEESPRKVINVIEECDKLRTRAKASAGRNANAASQSPSSRGTEPLDPKGEEFNKLKERILLLERVVLHTIGFELSVDHPYKFIVDQIKLLMQRRQVEYITPPNNLDARHQRDKLMNDLVQYSMNFANDSFQTLLCIQFPSENIAQACVFLGGQFAKATASDWVQVLEITNVENFASICVQLLDLVSEKKGDKSIFKSMRLELERLRLTHQSSSSSNSKQKAEGPSPKRQRHE